LHRIRVNDGPVIKTNANHRYATGTEYEALFIALCESAEVPRQQYNHLTDLGNLIWAMHSARESTGAVDNGLMVHCAVATTCHSSPKKIPHCGLPQSNAAATRPRNLMARE